MQSQDTRYAPRHRKDKEAPGGSDYVGRARGVQSRRDFRRGMDLVDRARAAEHFYSVLAAESDARAFWEADRADRDEETR